MKGAKGAVRNNACVSSRLAKPVAPVREVSTARLAIMAKHSCGIILYKISTEGKLLVLIGHMGGPFWRHKENRSWSIIKGELEEGEEPAADVALREFEEETGYRPDKQLSKIGDFKQPGGKVIHAWLSRDDWDHSKFVPGMFSMVWPKGSGRIAEFPEIDRVDWFAIPEAKDKIVKGQLPILDQIAVDLTFDHSNGSDEPDRQDNPT